MPLSGGIPIRVLYSTEGQITNDNARVEKNLRTDFAPMPSALRLVPDDIFKLFPMLREMLTP